MNSTLSLPPLPNGSRLSCGRLARRRKGSGRQSVPRQGHNTPLPLKRPPPASFKRSSESAKRKGAHGVVGPWRGPGDPEGRRPPPPTDSPLDGERSSRASSCAHGTRASVRRRWPPRVTGESPNLRDGRHRLNRAHLPLLALPEPAVIAPPFLH